MKEKIRVVFYVLGILVTINLFNSLGYINSLASLRWKLYFLFHISFLITYVAFLIKEYRKKDSLLRKLINSINNLAIPNKVKYIVGTIILIEFIHISMGSTIYPFADVGMFRYVRPKETVFNKILAIPKYYYKNNDGEVQIVEIRKQHLFFYADLLGLSYNNEYTFSAAYHYKGTEKNYEFLKQALQETKGIDTLWVGLHQVDYATGEVKFDPDIKRAVEFNDTARIHYGPIFIPLYQKEKIYGME